MKRIFALILLSVFCFGIARAESTPEAAFQAYVDALQKGDRDTYLNLLTMDSRSIVNPSSSLMRREYMDIKSLNASIRLEGFDRAVVTFTPASSKIPPYILRKENGQWKVDLKTMSKEYVFDGSNNWHKN